MKYIFSFLFFIGVSVVGAQQVLPIKIAKFTELKSNKCKALEKNLKAELSRNAKWKSLIASKKMSIAVVDLSNHDIKYAGVNGNNMVYAASLPKIAVLYAVMDAIDKGSVKDTPDVRKDLKLMIAKSNNAASTRMIDLVGYEKIEEVLRNAGSMLYDPGTGGGLWVGKRYAAAGKRYPDPLKGLSHAATPYQAANFYYHLVFGKLINFERSVEMLDILKDPELGHKFVYTLRDIAPNAKLYRKSGSWKNYHSDSVLVWGPERKYILVALIEDSHGEQIVRKLVEPVEKVLKASENLNCSK
ncbi:serine hydrolase [Tamlana haliotis]|uniref:beta-lactamase n=1 Tax=Pseudotamlana haliotis TaxID=2614804 RepID=A0A6N6MAG4_9FLAO|nr:serine hydrolase [Tamlana haliotis]KAB1067534.1 serine hydrolase [Tamlana haliotis]